MIFTGEISLSESNDSKKLSFTSSFVSGSLGRFFRNGRRSITKVNEGF